MSPELIVALAALLAALLAPLVHLNDRKRAMEMAQLLEKMRTLLGQDSPAVKDLETLLEQRVRRWAAEPRKRMFWGKVPWGTGGAMFMILAIGTSSLIASMAFAGEFGSISSWRSEAASLMFASFYVVAMTLFVANMVSMWRRGWFLTDEERKRRAAARAASDVRRESGQTDI